MAHGGAQTSRFLGRVVTSRCASVGAIGFATLLAVASGAAAASWGAQETLCPVCGRAEGALEAQVGAAPGRRAVAAWVDRGRVTVAESARGRRFGAPTKLTRAGRSRGIDLGVGANGTAVLAWQEEITRGRDVVQAAVRRPGGAWRRPETLTSVDPNPANLIGSARAVDVAVDAAGTAFVVYNRRVGLAGFRVQASILPAGGTWSGPDTVSQTPSGFQTQVPRVAASGSGIAIVLWRELQPAEGPGRFLSSAREGSIWGAPQVVSESAGPGEPRLAVHRDGSALAVWARGPVVAAYRQPAGVWGGEETVPRSDGGRLSELGIEAAGNALISWRGAGGRAGVVKVARRTARTASWDAPNIVSPPLRRPSDPQLAVAPNGVAMTGWQQLNTADIRVARAASGSSLTGRFRTAETIRPLREPTSRGNLSTGGEIAVGIDREGRSYAVWEEPTGGPNGLTRFSLRAARGPPGAGRQVALEPSQLLINQRIAQTAVRRTNALREALRAGLSGASIRNGSLGREPFDTSVQLAGEPTGEPVPPGPLVEISIPPRSHSGTGVSLSAR